MDARESVAIASRPQVDVDIAVAVDSVIKSFGEKRALKGISLAVRRGEYLGLLGPNGAGKSTLIRSIVGRVRPDAGKLSIGNSAPASAEARRSIGYVPQEIALYPQLSPRQNLETFGKLQGLGGAELRAAIEWCLEWAALADRASEPIKGFSGGMKRRLNMAAGLIHRPSILLMDEPTVGVDPQSRERIYEMIEELRPQGATLLYTTHYMEEAERLCDRIAIVDHGQVIASGTPDELILETFGGTHTLAVQFATTPTDTQVLSIEALGGAVHAARAKFSISDPAQTVASLVERVTALSLHIVDMSVTTPTLESVFLARTGRELRD